MRRKEKYNYITVFLLIILVLLGALGGIHRDHQRQLASTAPYQQVINKARKSGNKTYYIVNHNRPYFKKITSTKAWEKYSDLDSLGRCGPAEAVLGKETMPTEPRGRIGMVKPSGWHTIRYNDLIPDGKYLYNRCHLIGYQLSGENANVKNLITGTRYLNVEGMEPFENETANYIEKTGNHVHYRVTPCFQGDELVARGVLMEAESIEDDGLGLKFCVYCPNIQPGVNIMYRDGSSQRA